jgi:DNA-binding beta-propeller fold protein YncE
VTNRDVNTVTVVNIDTDTVLGDLGQDGSPFGIAVNEVNGEVYVMHGWLPSACPAQFMTVFSRTGLWLRNRALGDSCDGGWVDVNPNNGRIYVAATAVDQAWILNADASTRGVLGPPEGMGDEPFGLVVDPATSMIYVTNKADHTIRVIWDP